MQSGLWEEKATIAAENDAIEAAAASATTTTTTASTTTARRAEIKPASQLAARGTHLREQPARKQEDDDDAVAEQAREREPDQNNRNHSAEASKTNTLWPENI